MTDLKQILAQLQALYNMYRIYHWNASSYEEHLVYEKLYTYLEDEMDNIGEKIAGEGQKINSLEQLKLMQSINVSNPVEAERKFLSTLNGFQPKTMGVENLINSIYDAHEKNIYLLKMVV